MALDELAKVELSEEFRDRILVADDGERRKVANSIKLASTHLLDAQRRLQTNSKLFEPHTLAELENWGRSGAPTLPVKFEARGRQLIIGHLHGPTKALAVPVVLFSEVPPLPEFSRTNEH